LAEATMPF